MSFKNTLSVLAGSATGLVTSIAQAKEKITITQSSIVGTQVEFLHLILYSFIGGCVGWFAKLLLDYFFKRKT